MYPQSLRLKANSVSLLLMRRVLDRLFSVAASTAEPHADDHKLPLRPNFFDPHFGAAFGAMTEQTLSLWGFSVHRDIGYLCMIQTMRLPPRTARFFRQTQISAFRAEWRSQVCRCGFCNNLRRRRDKSVAVHT